MIKGASAIGALLSSLESFQIFAGANIEESGSGRTSSFADLHCKKLNISLNTLHRIYITVETEFNFSVTAT